MKPILFSPNTTDFSTNGVGRLSDAISCVVHEVLNGEFELEMQYPITGKHIGEIKHSAIIAAQASQTRGLQAFRIYKISKPLNGRITIYARHISYQLSFIPVAPFYAENLTAALAGFSTYAAEDNPFTISADFTSGAEFRAVKPDSIRSYLGGMEGSILDVYGGEWEFDMYTATLHRERGADNGYMLLYGKNITDLTQEENIENTYTGIMPYWEQEDVRVMLPEKVVHASTAENFPFQRTIVQDFSDAFDNAPTEAQLRQAAADFITANKIGIPAVSLSVDFVHISGEIDLGDTVTVRFEKLGVDVAARVVEIEWDVLRDRYNAVQIGDKRGSLAATIEAQIDALTYTATTAEVLRNIDRATGVLDAGTRGHVVINRNAEGYANEILFMDTESPATATNVLRINMNGIGFSSSGYTGPYYQAWTLDGHMSLGGVNNAYGHLSILDPSGNVIGEWSKDGIVVDQGIIDLLRGTGKIGLYVDGATVRLGDFEINDKYGRQVIESDDEMTGMSGEPTEEGGLYFWAGYEDENTYMMAINKNDVYIRGKDSGGNWHTYALAQTLARLGG